MSTDRELLEMAAKAYWGSEIDDVCSVEWGEQDGCILYTHGDNQDHNGADRTYCWNPLTDDGDALRLALKLRIGLEFGPSHVYATGPGLSAFYSDEESCGSTGQALRNVIVRVAAAIGRAMP